MNLQRLSGACVRLALSLCAAACLAELDRFVARIKRDGRLVAAARRYGLGEIVFGR